MRRVEGIFIIYDDSDNISLGFCYVMRSLCNRIPIIFMMNKIMNKNTGSISMYSASTLLLEFQ